MLFDKGRQTTSFPGVDCYVYTAIDFVLTSPFSQRHVFPAIRRVGELPADKHMHVIATACYNDMQA
jgi:hypothetical protein